MKVLPFKIPKIINSSITVQVDKQPYFYDTLHQHPEIQITLIIQGTGTLFQGEHIGEYQPGDVFVIGANIPHVLKSDACHYEDAQYISHAISVFFDEESLGVNFFNLPELNDAKQFMQQSKRGMKLIGVDKIKVSKMIKQMVQQNGIDKIISLLRILKTITSSDYNNYLSQDYYSIAINENEGIRLNNIFQFTLREYHRSIKLDEVADMANMTAPAFCRYFKQRTRKTYINFLNDIRIAHAGKLLLQDDLGITQVAYQTGFGNLSHFNRLFKKTHGITPSIYKKVRQGYI